MIQYIIVVPKRGLVKQKFQKNGEILVTEILTKNAPKDGETPRTLSHKWDRPGA